MIDPNNVTTIRVGELPTEVFSLTDMIPHEVGTDLKKGSLNDLAIFISAFIGSSEGVGFRAVSVTDGQTLPTTTKEEFILVGKGTYYNVVGGSTLILTEELNAIVSNGSYWFIGVEIPINFEFTGITQEIREGFLDTTPSEDALFKALALKADILNGNLFTVTDFVVTIAGTQTFEIPNNHKVINVLVNGQMQYQTTGNNLALVNRWSQTDNIITLSKTTSINNYIYIISK